MRGRRCLLPSVPCHVTQRGVNRGLTFNVREDRETYLRLLREHASEVEVTVLGWCLMGNHVHLVLLPPREDSVSVMLRRVHGRYAQYFNARWGRSGHLWQNRFFACVLARSHLWKALAYVDRNPVRAGIAPAVTEYRWSSARAHVQQADPEGVVNMAWWRQEAPPDWEQILERRDPEAECALRSSTFAGRPLGDAAFIAELAQRFHRQWLRGRPSTRAAAGRQVMPPGRQGSLF